VQKIRINRVAAGCSTELKLLEGSVLEAKKAGPFSDLPPLPKGGSMTIQVVFGCPASFDSRDVWVVETLEVFNALKAAGHELAALRFRRRYSLQPIGPRQVITFPVGHPDFDIEAI
jgi:hypothetical protein